VADHELAAAVEQVHETRRAVRALEDVILGDLDHWQPPAVGVQRVPLPGELLLPGEELLAGGQPLLTRYHLGHTHRAHPLV